MRGIPEETKARILKAASALFYAQGIRAVGVDTIAEKADVTKRTLYRHFASKDDLVAAYLEGRHQPLLAALARSAVDTEGDVGDRIQGIFQLIEMQASNADWHGCPFARAMSELVPAEGDAVTALARHHKREFEDWLSYHLFEAGCANAPLLARQIMVLLDGAILHTLIHRVSDYARSAGLAAKELVASRHFVDWS